MDRVSRLFSRGVVACICKTVCAAILILLAGCDRSAVVRQPPLTGADPAQVRKPAAMSTSGSASATTPIQSAPAQSDKDKKTEVKKKSVAVVQVFYATDRSRSAQSDPSKIFGSKRGQLSYGSCEIGIPRDSKPGLNETAAQARANEAPGFRPTLRKVTPREYDTYLEQLKGAIAKSAKKSAFVFVHGYNVTFAEAARRTARMKYDLGFDGAAIFFSWPSKGRADAYSADEADVEWAQPDLKEFLKDFATKTKARNIYLIAHSMGNRALTKAYIYLASERPELRKVFREVILVAPDIDSDQFKRDIAPALAASSSHTTLYTSSRDLALKASNKFQNYPRAGDSGSNLLLFEGIETIDASNVSTGLGGYGYLADNPSVLADIYHLIRDGKSPAERSGLKTVNASSGQYWRFRSR